MLSGQDRELWAAFARGVAPLPGRRPASEAAPPRAAPVPAPPLAAPMGRPPVPATPPAPPPAPPPLVLGQRTAGLDERRWRALGSDRLRPERTLDLHGHTATAAHRALDAFLLACVARDIRCVEIITGRGAGEGGGVIRRELPHWLEAPALRGLVLAARHAHPANPGAVRLLLRRRRPGR